MEGTLGGMDGAVVRIVGVREGVAVVGSLVGDIVGLLVGESVGVMVGA